MRRYSRLTRPARRTHEAPTGNRSQQPQRLFTPVVVQALGQGRATVARRATAGNKDVGLAVAQLLERYAAVAVVRIAACQSRRDDWPSTWMTAGRGHASALYLPSTR